VIKETANTIDWNAGVKCVDEVSGSAGNIAVKLVAINKKLVYCFEY
jgi:hypothetical protein